MFPLRDNVPSRSVPVVTVALIAVNVGVFVYQAMLPERALYDLMHVYGIVPRRYVNPLWAWHVGFPGLGLSALITTQFLHGGLIHLIGNMWTLWIFGDNVEDRMGPLRFLGFYLLCGIAAGLLHILTNPGSMVPAIGASGAIAGVLGAYFLLYPMARVVCLVPIVIIPVIIELPAFVFALFWFAMQFYSGTASLAVEADAGGVAWWAHIGGFLAGMALLTRFLRPAPPQALRGA